MMDFIDDHLGGITVIIIVAAVVLLIWDVHREVVAKRICIQHGHKWVEVDHTYQTTYIDAGKIMVPLSPARVSIMGCK